MKYLLGIDFGGGASKATLMSENGNVVATNTVEYPTYYPKNGYAEQKPHDWYIAIKSNINSIIEKSKIKSEDIICVALDAATHTAVLCDENFNVLRDSIYWTDSRAIKEVEYLKQNYNDFILDRVLHSPDTIWTLPQLMWIKKNESEIFSRAAKIMFAKDYVRHCLTDDYVTDYIEAEGSMMFDYKTLTWSEKLCGIIDIDVKMLPKIVKPSDIAGTVTAEAAKETGLSCGTKVICGTTDTVMEVFAAGAVEKEDMTVKLATAGRICVVTDRAYPDKNLINYSHISNNLWYPGTATKSCAASYRWYRDTFGGEYNKLDFDAENVEIGCDGLIFHPYLNGELTPYADPKLCGSFIGIRAGHTKAHFTRAVLEGVALSMLDCKTALEQTGIPHNDKAVIIGGGGKSPLWRKILSDVLGIKLIELKYNDSSFGTCMLAGIAVKIFDSPRDALEKCNCVISETEPDMENHEKYLRLFKKYKKVHDALAPIYSGEE